MHVIDGHEELNQLIVALGERGMSSKSIEMVESYIRSCWDKGVDVVLNPEMTNSYGTYCPTTNTLTLGEKAISCNVEFIETLEHEFVHVLQDQLAGIHNADMHHLGIPTSQTANEIVSANYNVDDHTHQLEAEAFTIEEAIDNPMEGTELLF